MFEKEAEEIANKRCHEIMCYGHCSFSSPKHHRCGQWHKCYEIAKECMKFGYNKGKNEAKELLGKLLDYLKCQVWIADKPIMQKDIAEAEQFLSEVEK